MRSVLLLCAPIVLTVGCAPSEASEAAEGGATSADLEEEAAPRLTFGADWKAELSGSLRAGRTVTVAYDAARVSECAAYQGGVPQFATTGHAQLGDGPVLDFWAAGNAASPSVRSEFTLPKGAGGDLAVWFETTSRYGCHSFDSAFGANYHFTVKETLHRPDWVGAARVVISRTTCEGGPCDGDRRSLEEGFQIDSWARQRAAIRQADFRVYEPGLTDRDDASLWEKLETRVHYRYGNTGEYRSAYAHLDGRVGNDARFAIDLMSLDPLGARERLSDRAHCPAGLSVSADGASVSTSVDFWFSIEGAELRPAAGGTFRGSYADAAAYYAICLP